MVRISTRLLSRNTRSTLRGNISNRRHRTQMIIRSFQARLHNPPTRYNNIRIRFTTRIFRMKTFTTQDRRICLLRSTQLRLLNNLINRNRNRSITMSKKLFSRITRMFMYRLMNLTQSNTHIRGFHSRYPGYHFE